MTEVKTQSRKYTLAEIEGMRSALRWMLTSSGVSYNGAERDAQVEDRLRTHMQNGTDPSELQEALSRHISAEQEHQLAQQKYYQEMRAKQPPPRVLKTKEDVIDEWFQTCVAQYDGASTEASELYDGFMGRTLKSFANSRAPDGINIRQSDMEHYLDAKGIKSRRAMFAKRYDGIRHIIHGNVRSGSYGT